MSTLYSRPYQAVIMHIYWKLKGKNYIDFVKSATQEISRDVNQIIYGKEL
jgi:hypothetical protein